MSALDNYPIAGASQRAPQRIAIQGTAHLWEGSRPTTALCGLAYNGARTTAIVLGTPVCPECARAEGWL